ncbi:peritrophin-1-like [Hylaeus anthracinus]|uniref:peritrophin-1-like n=1 Tax=Hylaeus anthracinus TaxID=313031 RepID=UPI0023B8A5B9|nr:peritrophin-1-like [Hylaeus anthracinus]
MNLPIVAILALAAGVLSTTISTATTTTTPKPNLMCYPGLRVPHECHCNERCEQGYYYDYERKVCDITSRTKCWRGHCVPDELLPHDYDCSKYSMCGPTGTKVLSQNCAEGYLFDCDLKNCVPQDRLGRCCVVIPPHAFNQEDIKKP